MNGPPVSELGEVGGSLEVQGEGEGIEGRGSFEEKESLAVGAIGGT